MNNKHKKEKDIDKHDLLKRNPFIFDKPIKHSKSFFGRTEELNEIKLLLDKAENERYQSVMIIGKRSSGKSSFLNQVVKISKKLNYITIKLPLDEGSIKDQLDFFKTIYSMILDELPSNGNSNLKQKFFNSLERLEIEGEIPLGFAKLYVNRKKTDIERNEIPYYLLKKDFEYLFNILPEESNAIVICIDEADILTLNKELIQLIRNIFQDVEGYILILVGTDKLTEKISDVFSPIPRFFYKINIGPYRSKHEAIESIEEPLKSIDKLSIEFNTVNDIVKIANNNPYEINLISYHVYEDAVINKSLHFELSEIVFEKIKNQKTEITVYEKQFFCLSKEEQDILKELILIGGIGSIKDFAFCNSNFENFNRWEESIKRNIELYRKIIDGLLNKNFENNGKNPVLKVTIGEDGDRYFEIYDSWLIFFIKYVLMYKLGFPDLYGLKMMNKFQMEFTSLINNEMGGKILESGSCEMNLEPFSEIETKIKNKKKENESKGKKILNVKKKEPYGIIKECKINENTSKDVEDLKKILDKIKEIIPIEYDIK